MNNDKPLLLGYWEGKRWKQARAVFDGGGLSPTLTAEMGSHGNNYVYVMEFDMREREREKRIGAGKKEC